MPPAIVEIWGLREAEGLFQISLFSAGSSTSPFPSVPFAALVGFSWVLLGAGHKRLELDELHCSRKWLADAEILEQPIAILPET